MNRKNIQLLLCIILVHAIWYGAGMVWRHFYNGDSYEYIYLADSIRHGGYYSGSPALPLNEYKQSLRTPVYSLFLLLCYNLPGYASWLVFGVQNLISVASCFLIYQAFGRLPHGRKYNRLYLLLICFYPAQMVFSDMIVPDILLQFFLMLYFRQLLLTLGQPRAGGLLLMSLWLVLATLTKPVVYPFLFLHLLFAGYYALRNRKAVLLVWGLLPVLIMAGYGYWNKQRTGLFHISSVQSVNLLEHNVSRFLEHRYGKAYSDSVIISARNRIAALPHLKEKYEYASAQGAALVQRDLLPYALFHARESCRFFLEPGKSEIDLYSGSLTYHQLVRKVNFYTSYRDGGLSGAIRYLAQYPVFPLILFVLLFNLLRIAGGLMFVFNRKIPLAVRIACTLYILYFAAITGPVANTRYFLPVLPVLSGMAAIGWSLLPVVRFKKKTPPAYE